MLSKRLETATKFVDHYATHDNEVLNTLLADDLVYEFAPSRSLDHMKPTDKAGYIELKQGMKLAMTGYPLDVKKYIEGESANSKYFDLSLTATGDKQTPRSYADKIQRWLSGARVAHSGERNSKTMRCSLRSSGLMWESLSSC
jgi:hypothetical protein